MIPDKEIRDLREALAASPENAYIRRLLINKLRGVPGHEAELEREVQTLMRAEPNDLDLKAALIEVYFAQGKNSACLIVYEELGHPALLSPETRILIATGRRRARPRLPPDFRLRAGYRQHRLRR